MEMTNDTAKQNEQSSKTDVEKCDEKCSNTNYRLWTQIFGALAVSIVHSGLGTLYAFTGIVLPQLTDPESEDIYLNRDQAALFNSILMAGSMIGSFCTGPLLVTFGQRKTLLLVLPLYLAGWNALCFSYSATILISCRFYLGFISSIMIDCCTSYIVECAHENLRGKLVSIIDISRQLGFLLVYSVGSSYLTWRNTGLICSITTCTIPFICLLFVPNSPRWLLTHSKVEEAEKSLIFYRGPKFDYKSELNEIKNQIEKNTGSGNVLGQIKLLCNRHIGLRMLLVAIFNFTLQFNGNSVVLTYAVTIFKATDTGIDEYLSTVLSGAIRVIGAVSFLLVAERFPRKTIFILNYILTGISLICLGVCFYITHLGLEIYFTKYLPIICLCVFSISSGQVQPVISMLRSELLPNSIRSVGVGLAIFSLCTGGFIVTMLFPLMMEYIHPHFTFFFYGFCGIAVALFVSLFVPETKGKTLEEINAKVVEDSNKK